MIHRWFLRLTLCLLIPYVAIAQSTPGTVFEVEILGERYPATVLAEPVWDPSNVRQRA